MGNKGSLLAQGGFLNVGDYLVSANGLFVAVMQEDGNFCVYRGGSALWCTMATGAGGQFCAVMQGDGNFCVYSGTSENHTGDALWCTMATASGGQFNAVMQDDGNFCVYSGSTAGPALWCTMATDPVADIEIASIAYDLAHATILQSSPNELYRQTVCNQTPQPQSSTISGSESVTETSGWSDSLAVKVGVSTTFETEIPFVADAKVTVSVDVTNTYTWNGSTAKAKVWGFNTPVNVPPGTTMVCLVAVTISTIAVPFTVSGTFILKSGTRVPGVATGVYTGSNSHDLTVTFVEHNSATTQLRSMTRALEPAKTISAVERNGPAAIVFALDPQ
jgi:hypothetical protein